MSCLVALRVVLCCVVLCYVMLCYVMFSYVLLCYVRLCLNNISFFNPFPGITETEGRRNSENYDLFIYAGMHCVTT